MRYHFFVCTNTRPEGHPLPSCGRRGGTAVFEAFQQELARRSWPPGVKVTATGCLTPCQCGPNVVVYPEEVWYAGLEPSDVTEVIIAHLDMGTHVERLLLPTDVRVW